MQEWMNFFISGFQSIISMLEDWQLFNVSVISILVACSILGVILRALVYKA